MRNLIIFILILAPFHLFSQNDFWDGSVEFFDPVNNEDYILNMKFVFLSNRDGTGGFQTQDVGLLDDMVQDVNSHLESFSESNCLPSSHVAQFPLPVDIQISVEYDWVDDNPLHIPSSEPFDMHVNLFNNDPATKWVCPDGSWHSFDAFVRDYNQMHPDTWNVFFLENLSDLGYIQDAYDNTVTLTETFYEHNNQQPLNTSDGCSKINLGWDTPPAIYITDFFTEWKRRSYFPLVYDENAGPNTAQAWIDVFPALLIHEMGHSLLNVQHPYCNGGCHHLMNNCEADNIQYSMMTQDIAKIHESLSRTSLRKFVSVEDGGGHDKIRVLEDTELSDGDKMQLFTDLYVSNNSTLTVKGEIYASPNAQIIVERGSTLIVDGGLITASHSEPWQSIRVEGDIAGQVVNGEQLAGRVLIRGNSVIENCVEAVSCDVLHKPWPEVQQYWGGIIQIENSTIRNCKRAAAFMRYAVNGMDDLSYIKNSIISNAKYPITIWASDGVEISGNTFDKVQLECILVHSATPEINGGNIFNDYYLGVSVLNPILGFSAGNIGAPSGAINDFQNGYSAIRLHTVIGSHDLGVSNNVIGNHDGALVYVVGESFFDFSENDLYGQGHVTLNYTKWIEEALIRNNSFLYDSDVYNYGENISQHNSNCFEHGGISVNGSIAAYQGQDLSGDPKEADNCFASNTDLRATPSSALFSYFLFDPSNNSRCEHVFFGANEPIEIVEGLEANTTYCGAGYSSSLPKLYCNPGKDDENLDELIAELEKELDELPPLSQSSTFEKYLRRKFRNCLRLLRLRKMRKKYIETKSVDSVRVLYSESDDLEIKQFVYALYVNMGDYDNARSYLTGFCVDSLNSYCYAQNIYLDYLTDMRNYELSSLDSLALLEDALRDNVMAKYSETIYTIITGKYLDSPAMAENRGLEAGLNGGSKIEAKIWPNPVKRGSKVFFKLSEDHLSHCDVRIFDNCGRLLFRGKSEDDYVDVPNDLPVGICVIEFVSSEFNKSFKLNVH